MRIRGWLNRLFKKEIIKPNVVVRYLFDDSTIDTLNRKGTTIISNTAIVIVKNRGVVIGHGLGTVSDFAIIRDNDEYVSASIIDLEIDRDKYELNFNDSFEVQYKSVVYDGDTNVLVSDITFVLEDAKLLSNERVTCHKNKIKSIEVERLTSK